MNNHPNRFATLEDGEAYMDHCRNGRYDEARKHIVPQFIRDGSKIMPNPEWHDAPYEEYFFRDLTC